LYHADFTDADRKALRDGALDGIILSFFLLQGAAFVFRPYDDPTGRYCGIYGNANMNALFYCIVFVAFLCRLHLSRKTNEAKWKKIFYFLFAGALVGFVMLTISKTAMIAVFAVLICYVILSDLKQLREKAGRVVLQMVLMSLLILFCIPITYAAARYIPPLFHHPVWYDGEYSEERVHGWDSWDSDKYISFDRMTNELSDRILPYLEKMGLTLTSHAAEPVVTQTEMATTSASTWDHRYDSSNGRIMIWKHYLAGGNLAGHSSTEGHQIDANWSAWHAQNMFIQFWYYYGIPSAVLFAICAIWMLFMALRRAWRGDSSIALMVSLYYLLFLLYGLFEATWYPGQMILLLAFFMPAFLMGGRQD
jgi:O-antigen ligase